MRKTKSGKSGFTLIELSIVLVIIGLIIGGVLVGQDLIEAAGIRAQISQIEQYNTAVNTFRGKYGYLPGDITASAAAQFGFVARSGGFGDGDGNGELDGANYSWGEFYETLYFWEDLTSGGGGLIAGNFNTYVDGADPTCSSHAACSAYWPDAKIGGGNVIYVYSGYAAQCCGGPVTYTGFGPNFFGLSTATSGGGNVGVGAIPAGPGLTVSQAYNIDQKMDDGMPMTGRVLAQFLSSTAPGGPGSPGWSVNASSPSSATCFDTTSNHYSLAQNNGTGVNCGLSFQFQ